MTLIFFFLVSFASFAAVIITPAFPAIATYFQVPESVMQGTMSGYLLGYAFGILLYGPLANRFGRKKSMFIGLSLSVLGTLVCLMAPNFSVFVVGRVIQALGASAGFKLVFTMIGDRFAGKEAAKKLAIVMLSFSIAPGIASGVGGYLVQHFIWQSSFFFLLGYTLLLSILAFFLPETATSHDPHAFRWEKFSKGYGGQFKNNYLLLSALLMGLTTSLVYLFATEAPFIAINQMGISPQTYGLFNFIPPIGLGLGALITRHLADKWSPQNYILLGIGVILAAMGVMGYFFIQGIQNGWTLFVPFGFAQIGNNLVYLGASGRALDRAGDKSYASAVMQFCNVGMAMTATWIIPLFTPQTASAIPLLFSCFAFGMFALWYVLGRKKLA